VSNESSHRILSNTLDDETKGKAVERYAAEKPGVTPEQRLRILSYHLGGDLCDELLNRYAQLFRDGEDGTPYYSLVIGVARRGFNLLRAFLPILTGGVDKGGRGLSEDVYARVTNNNLVGAWLAHNKSFDRESGRVCVVDDTLCRGFSVSRIVEDLRSIYGFKGKIDVFVVVKKDGVCFPSSLRGSGFECVQILPPVSAKQRGTDFVRAIHATSTPYVAFGAGFKIDLDKCGSGKIFECKNSAGLSKITESSISDRLLDLGWTFRDITTPILESCSVEAFALFSPIEQQTREKELVGRPPAKAEYYSALRFYVNRKLNIMLVVPYTTLRPCKTEQFVDDRICNIMEYIADVCPVSKDWVEFLTSDVHIDSTNREEISLQRQRLTHRILHFASSYLMGKDLLRRLGFSEKDYAFIDDGGIPYHNKTSKTGKTSIYDFLDNIIDDATKLGEPVSHSELCAAEQFSRIWNYFPADKAVMDVDVFGKNEIQKHYINQLETYLKADVASYRKNGLFQYLYNGFYFGITVKEDTWLSESYERDGKRYLTISGKEVEFSVFQGIPAQKLLDLLLEILRIEVEKEKNDFIVEFRAAMLELLNYGGVVSHIKEFNGVIGAVFTPGEENRNSIRVSNSGLDHVITYCQQNKIPIGEAFIKVAVDYSNSQEQNFPSEVVIRSALTNCVRTNRDLREPEPSTTSSLMVDYDDPSSKYFVDLLNNYEFYMLLAEDSNVAQDKYDAFANFIGIKK